jgi:hypothetical protein
MHNTAQHQKKSEGLVQPIKQIAFTFIKKRKKKKKKEASGPMNRCLV